MKLKKNNGYFNQTLLFLLLVPFAITGCGIFGSDDPVYEYPACNLPIFEMHDHLPNFGFEEGYYFWYNDGTGEEKIPLLRNQNHLSIRFYEEYGEAFHDSVLAAYNIEPLWSQTFGKEVPMPGFYRVKDMSAEYYYTTYGDTTLDRLGNLPEVEYVLPAYYRNKEFCDLRETERINFTFKESITDSVRLTLIDSLIAADHIELHQLFPGEVWSPPGIYVTKESPMSPYELYHHYYKQLFLERNVFISISMDFAQTARFYE
jgi:hypothetical protein